MGGSARFTGPLLPRETRGEPLTAPVVEVPNGPEWEMYVKLAPPVGAVALEVGLGVAVQPKAVREREATELLRETNPYGLYPAVHWEPRPARWYLTWSLGARLDLARAYLTAAYHNRRGVVAGMGARF
ncbi:hypothetical protein [Geochorda subterranea]|uniref:Uncharacterized protein n=1 Tax=Geochorda subterranea TaxID=3109564 RepID=A0ABZ1BP17_9FIRM|nr:hypothetical protein [Limnochorda sp. LNt]WRP14464.1 hypothetical protein VLY81_13750 [Limnochorda sp. LNt]